MSRALQRYGPLTFEQFVAARREQLRQSATGIVGQFVLGQVPSVLTEEFVFMMLRDIRERVHRLECGLLETEEGKP